MAKTNQPVNNVQEPFDLVTAIRYMKDNGEVVRCVTEGEDFYMFLDVQRRPSMVNGRRQWVETEKVVGYTQWGNEQTSLALSQLAAPVFYLMNFDDKGNPIWELPGAESEGGTEEALVGELEVEDE